jgi:hypothetical protein
MKKVEMQLPVMTIPWPIRWPEWLFFPDFRPSYADPEWSFTPPYGILEPTFNWNNMMLVSDCHRKRALVSS